MESLSQALLPGKMSPDGKIVEFTLRKGIKFHSGDPLTTKDVEFSHNRALKNNPTHQRAMSKSGQV